MKSGRSSRFFVLCAVVFLAGLPILRAQLADLPVKAGLWETRVSTKIGPSNLDSGPTESCFSAGTTLGDYLTATNAGAAGTKCSVSNKVVTPHGISYDTACSGPSTASKGRIDFQLADAGHFGGTSHTTVTGTSRGKPVNMAIDKMFTAKFVKADCGAVKPLVVPGSAGK